MVSGWNEHIRTSWGSYIIAALFDTTADQLCSDSSWYGVCWVDMFDTRAVETNNSRLFEWRWKLMWISATCASGPVVLQLCILVGDLGEIFLGGVDCLDYCKCFTIFHWVAIVVIGAVLLPVGYTRETTHLPSRKVAAVTAPNGRHQQRNYHWSEFPAMTTSSSMQDTYHPVNMTHADGSAERKIGPVRISMFFDIWWRRESRNCRERGCSAFANHERWSRQEISEPNSRALTR